MGETSWRFPARFSVVKIVSPKISWRPKELIMIGFFVIQFTKGILSFAPHPPPNTYLYPQEIAGFMKGFMKTHWFPLIRPAIKPLFLGGGGVARIPLTIHQWTPRKPGDLKSLEKNQ